VNRIISGLNQISYTKLIWVLAVSETLHNLEEAIWLPTWSKTAGLWHPMVGLVEFRFAVTILTIIFYGVIYYFSRCENKLSKYLMSGVLISVLFNVFMPHLVATIITSQYVPGLISGMLLNIPVTIYLLWRGLNERFFKIKTLILAGVGFALVAFPLLQLFFALGRVVDRII